MKKNVSILLLFTIIAFSLGGCAKGNVDNQPSADSSYTVVTSFYPMYIAALNVIGDTEGVTLVTLAEPQTGCLHDYQLSPSNMITLEGADLFIANGAGMESFMDKALSTYPDLPVVTLTEGMELLDENPHVWTNIDLYSEQVEKIALSLSTMDSKSASLYSENAAAYIDKLTQLKKDMTPLYEKAQDKNIIIFHDAFAYLAQDLGLNIVEAVEIEGDTSFSASQVTDIIETAKSAKVNTVFCEAQYKTGIVETIAKEIGAKAYVLDSCVSGELTKDAYLSAMKNNISVLKEALN